MQTIGGRLIRGLLGIGAVLAASAAFGVAAAAAAVTTSNVTSAGPAFGYGNVDLPAASAANLRTVSGTSNGTTGDHVDIRCEAPGIDVLLTSGVNVAADGSFSTTVDDTTKTSSSNNFMGQLCRFVAVPAGTDPPDLTPYTGPVVGNGEQQTNFSHSIEDDYYIAQPQGTAFDDYDSLGSCGLCDARLYAGDLTPGTHYLWYDNAAIYSKTYHAAGTAYPYAQIDGVDVYNPHGANDSLLGAPALTYTHTVDPSTGNMVITEQDPFVKCTSTSTCTAYTSAGLELDRTIIQNQTGRVVRITDVIKSTDNASHLYSFAYDEYQQDTSNNQFQFPGDTGYKAYAGGATGTLSSSPVQTIYALADGTQAPSVNDPVGALTVSPAPSVARFGCTAATTHCAGFDLVYAGTVPAGGSTTISQYFGLGASQTEVAGYAAANTQALTPTVAITNPATDGTTVHTTSIPVSGTVSSAVTSLSVNGQGVTPNSSGVWSTPVHLSLGSNTITAVAKDGEGVSATATRMVTYTPAPVTTSVKLVRTTVKGTRLRVTLTCTVAPGSRCQGSVSLTVRERVKLKKHKTRVTTVTVGKARYSLGAGSHTVTVALNAAGRKLLTSQKKLSVSLRVRLGRTKVAHRTITFKTPHKKHKK